MTTRVLSAVALATGLFLVPPLVAQPQQAPPPEVFKVLGISVEGNVLADPAAIIANSGLKVGNEILVPGDQVAQAIRRLWSLKIFDDVQVAIDRKVGDGVFLVIRVRELPRFESITIDGEDEISEDDILKKVNLVRGQVFPPQEAKRIEKEILKLYEKEGYLLASAVVTATPVDTSANRVRVGVVITEGREVQVEAISFEGNQVFDDGDLKGEMSEISEGSWWKIFSSASFDRKKYDEDKKKIVQFYRRSGYRDAEILSDSIWYSADRSKMFIQMRVHEGPQYHIRRITWQGNTVFPAEVLGERLGLSPGDVYDAEAFERNLRGNEAQTDVASLYLDTGYLRLNMDAQETRVGEDSIDILINVYEMNQFKIGQITIKGNTKTYEKVIRRELYTRPGDYFSRAAIIRSIRQLSVLNYFNPEKIKPDYALVDDKTVDLTYEVEEKSSDNVNASVGYSGAFGFTGAIGFTINNFSISQPLKGGAGQTLNFEWQFGEASRFRTFTIGFTEPWLFDTPTLFGATVFDTRQVYLYDLQQTGGTLRLGRRLRWPDDYFRGDLILKGQFNDITEGRGIYREGKSAQVSLTTIISRSSIDNPTFPVRGSNVSFSFEISGGPFLPGNIDFHKYRFSAEWYVPVINSSRVALALNLEVGYLQQFYSTSPIPPIDLFFMGGTGLGYIATTPLRGYEEQSVGPRNALGQLTGGRVMNKQTAELRLLVAQTPILIYALGFAEAGMVWRSWEEANFSSLARSAGFGARIQIMPIGMIGFDYGYGFDDVFPRDGRPDGWRFHFIFGRGF